MKKLFLIITATLFVGIFESFAQTTAGDSGRLYRSVGNGAERGNDNGINAGNIFAAMGDWSVDLTISQYTPTEANLQGWLGQANHNGFGASGWGSFAAGAYNRA